MLVLSRHAGETILIGDTIVVAVAEIQGDRIKLAIKAPQEIQILRGELRQSSQPPSETQPAPSPQILELPPPEQETPPQIQAG